MSNHKHINLNNRRNFLRKMVGAGCSALTLNPFLSTLTNLGLMNASAAANRPIYSCDGSDYKALVCIMLVGGNDSFNMLVPYDQLQYNAYEDLRGGVHDPDRDSTTHNLTGMALDRSELNELHPVNTSDLMGRQFGLHPKMSKIRHLFNGTDPDNLTNPVDNYISI